MSVLGRNDYGFVFLVLKQHMKDGRIVIFGLLAHSYTSSMVINP